MNHLTLPNYCQKGIIATVAALSTLTIFPGKSLAVTGFTGNYDPTHWTLNGSVGMQDNDFGIDTTSAGTGTVQLYNQPNSSTATWSILINSSMAGTISFDWVNNSVEPDDNYILSYYLNSTITPLTTGSPGNSSTPVSLAVNNGDTFGFRIENISSATGTNAAILTVNNFDNVQAVPFDFSPALGLGLLGIHQLYRYWRKSSSIKSKE